MTAAMLLGGQNRPGRTTHVWLTQPAILDALGGWQSFDLDPCAPAVRPWPMARHHFTRADDGLVQPWHGRVWLNPPYGRTIGRWLGRMSAHGHGVALIFARTETAAFFRHVWATSSALLFLEGRQVFLRPDGQPHLRPSGKPATAAAPSVLCAYGNADAEVLAFCGLRGQFVPLRFARSMLVELAPGTWREELVAWLRAHRGPVSLADLYRAFARHPKARRNPNYTAKIRQVLQAGPFRRVDRGMWECAA